ncbi:MAG: helix-turn-helix domain-containing protein [Bdellovibrionales bacterium]
MRLNARHIGLRIRQARMAKGMTQAELSKALGIDRGSVGRWETGRSVPRQVGMPRVASVLGKSAEWLLEGSGDPSPALQNIEVLRAEQRTLKEIREEVKKLCRQSESKPKMHTSNKIAGTDQTIKVDHNTLADIINGWNKAKPEARLMAALLITGDWSYKLKLMNRDVSVDEDVLSALGTKQISV